MSGVLAVARVAVLDPGAAARGGTGVDYALAVGGGLLLAAAVGLCLGFLTAYIAGMFT